MSSTKKNIDFSNISLLILDVDGVLTDGTIAINADGSESKFFNTLDGHGIRMWQRAGKKVALLSGRFSTPTQLRAQQLEIEIVHQDSYNKLEAFEQILEQTGLTCDQTAYVGDDLLDIPVIRKVAFGVAVASAVDEARRFADYVTSRPGGAGAVREVIEYILRRDGAWEELIKRYISK